MKHELYFICWPSLCTGSFKLQTTRANNLRQVLFLVQVMSDISKQACIHNERVPQCTKMRICIHHQ